MPLPLASYEAVIFDMDGVIVDSEPRHERAFHEVVAEVGYEDRHSLRFSDYVGRTDRILWEDFVELHRPAQSLDDLMTMKRDRMIEILRAERPFFGGIRELIQDLAGTHTLGLASGSERLIVEEVLTLGELHPFFRSVITGSEVLDGKPEPEIFHRSADALGTPASACLVIEDSRPGVTAALAAGMQVVAVTHTHSAEELADATLVVPDVAALRAAVFRG